MKQTLPSISCFEIKGKLFNISMKTHPSLEICISEEKNLSKRKSEINYNLCSSFILAYLHVVVRQLQRVFNDSTVYFDMFIVSEL